MRSVLNLIYLISCLSFGTLYFFGLGWLIIYLLGYRTQLNQRQEFLSLKGFSIALSSGLIINYLIVLIVHKLDVSLLIGSILSFLGIMWFCLTIYTVGIKKIITLKINRRIFGAIIYSLVCVAPIVVDPLADWDARSFWFFHGKILFYSGVFGNNSGWVNSVINWSHLDYPKLIPVIAAQITRTMGFWNEYLPKLSLFFVWLPAITWLFSVGKKSFSFLFLLLTIPLAFYPHIWNGYMDAFIAAYFSISLIAFMSFLTEHKSIDIISVFCFLFLIINIKNEGYLLFLSESIVLIITLIIHTLNHRICIKFKWNYLFGLSIGIFPVFLWEFYKRKWNIINDLALGSKNFFFRIVKRISDGSLQLILGQMAFQIIIPLIMIITLLLILKLLHVRINMIYLIPFFPAILYFTGIIIIYLSTPTQVEWHLATSVDRTMFAVNGALYVVCYKLLENFESSVLEK